MKKAIVLDCDEILLAHLKGFKDYLLKYKNKDTCGYPASYSLVEWLGVSESECQELMKEFNTSKEFQNLEPYDEYTVEYLHKFIKQHKNIDIFVVTKCGKSSTEMRIENLNAVFGDIFKDIIVLDNNESKKDAFQKIMKTHKILTVADDYIENIKVAQELGLDTVILTCAHNVQYFNDKKYTFVDNWKYMFNYLTEVAYFSKY